MADAPSGDEGAPASEQPTSRLKGVVETPSRVRLFGTKSFFRLWLAQVVSSLGDWIGLVAIISIAARVGGSSPEAAVGIVMSARMIPGFFLASVGGVLVDRWDRKKVMVTCDIGRGLTLATLPFIETVWGLFLASLMLEVFTLLWSPAKEASVPNLVASEQLTTANSLSLAAAYGTFPVGSAVFAGLAKVADIIGRNTESLEFLRVDQESLAIYADTLTFLVSAALIASLTLPRVRERKEERIDLGRAFTDVKEGWRMIGTSPLVRSVMVGIGTGLIGGGMVVPLGPPFSTQVLKGGPAGFGLLLTALGMGMAIGVVSLSAIQRHLPRERIFPFAVLGAGGCLLAAASMSTLAPAMAFVGCIGFCAGTVYVVGFTILQEHVADELRGRVFAALYTMVRLCLLIALTVGPFLSSLLDGLSERWLDREIAVGGVAVSLPGVRLTLWLGGLVILAAGMLAQRSMSREGSVRAEPAGA